MAGWFVTDVADSPAFARAAGAVSVPFDRRGDRFPDHGISIRALEPGQPSGLYHAESLQEDFLVLGGECIAIIDGQEQRLAQWSFLHCPAGTAHVFVGAGDRRCWILMAGPRRPGKTIHYPVCELAARHGASVAEATDDPVEAYAKAGWGEQTPAELPWPPV
jgi:uncharacterized cupin superfamily protein